MRNILIFATIFAHFATMALAGDPLEPRRTIFHRDTDFPGHDIQSVFDTTLEACESACLSRADCGAFTFNSRKSSCFLKSTMGEPAVYDGAFSAQVLDRSPALIAAARARMQALDFLTEADIASASARAADMPHDFRVGGWQADDLARWGREAEAEANLASAMHYFAGAVVLSDSPGDWIEYARLSNAAAMAAEKSGETRDLHDQALDAAVSGFLRSPGEAQQANALTEMAVALEALERGSTSIPALRLAQNLSPRDDTARALERALGLFGFRLTETTVDSNAAAPRICATFSEDLAETGVDYAPFVSSEVSGIAVSATGPQLCIEGLTHGERYSFTLRPGLPSASGEALAKPVQLSQYVRDRAPSVHFPGRAYVLPPTEDAGLPVVTVNSDTLDLTLSRLPEGNLVRAFEEDWFGRSLSIWDEEWFNDRLAEPIWEGTAEVGSELNRDVTTRLPIGELADVLTPGVYVLHAALPGLDQNDHPPASQWFVISDLGATAYTGDTGTWVFVRSLSSGALEPGVTVELRSETNAVLAVLATDTSGSVHFEPGGNYAKGAAGPALVTLKKGGDFTFLSLSDPAFDLSDRGVEGHPPAPPIDMFLTTERGAYRAGETIYATALARDAQAKALEGLPVTAVLTRPDGVEYARHVSNGDSAGGYVFALPTAGSAPRGTWRLDLFADPDAPALASTTLLVEDFLPERIDFDLALSEPRPGLLTSPVLDIDARYLFGAPGADLAVSGDLVLRAAEAVEGWPGYRFGLHEGGMQPVWGTLGETRTDADGHAALPVTFPEAEARGTPLEAALNILVQEGSGRPVERGLTVPVAPQGTMIGIKPGFEDGVPEGTEASFQLVALSPTLEPVPLDVTWELNRVTTRYQWYSSWGQWNWEPTETRERVASGRASLGDEPVSVTAPTEWGSYELVVTGKDGGYVSASVGFTSGWYAPANALTSPDILEASLDATRYNIGDTATLRFVPRTAGKVLVQVMSSRVISTLALEAVPGENTVTLPVTEDWGTGAYVVATLVQPLDSASDHDPVRALGLAHASVDPGDKALTARFDVAEEVRPRGPLDVVLKVDGIAEGETAYATIAAVDVGILNVTGFDAPDPSDHYFGQRRLGLEIRDLYGRLIDGRAGAMGQIRSGGGADAFMRMQAPPPTGELMAQFSGPLTVSDGEVRATFDLPAFNGSVRLMAIVWSKTGIGQAATDVLVRDPVVLTASLPRFLAPGDEGRLLLEVTHATGPVGELRLLAGSETGAVAVAGSGFARSFEIAAGATERISLPVTAEEVGVHPLDVTLVTPDGIELTKQLNLPVMRLDPEVAETSRFTLAPGESFTLTQDLFAGLAAGHATITAGPLARLDAAGLIDRLDRYPYGCTEQQVSRALPLLYLSGLAEAMGLAGRDDVETRVNDAITGVLANQSSTGSFGLWRPDSGDLWLDAFVSDFLARARAEGYDVPDTAFRAAMDNLRNRVNYYPDFEEGGEDLAYALYVLAREGGAAMGDLRYYADVRADAFATPLANAQLGAALAAYGDPMRADAMFARASSGLAAARDTGQIWRDDYGTVLRDTAAVLALAVEAGSDTVDRAALVDRLAGAQAPFSTQEASWMLRAAHALLDDAPGAGLTLDGKALTGPLVEVLSDVELETPKVVANTGTEATELTVTSFGVPDVAPPASGNGYAIERRYFTMEGEPADPGEVAHGTRLVTLITVTPWEAAGARLMITDPLPAGFEIDNPNLLRAGDIRALDWLQVVEETEAVEFRQDRFLAAVDWDEDTPIRLAYVVRAVTPGVFHHPAPSVEDMYRPAFRAVGDAGEVVVLE